MTKRRDTWNQNTRSSCRTSHEEHRTDAAQTLFEFRFANPRALNVMASSGVFSTHKLQVNYRSNQEILDLANLALDEVDANQAAQLHLRSNSLAPVSADSFRDRCRLEYVRVTKQRDIEEKPDGYVRTRLKPYIDECLDRGEQVAVLAYSNQVINHFMEAIQTLYPDRKIARLSAARSFDSTVLSSFVKRFWNEVQFMPKATITSQVVTELNNHIDELVRGCSGTSPAAKRRRQAVSASITRWADHFRPLAKTLYAAYAAGAITQDQFLGAIKKDMFNFESSENSIRQSLEKRKQAELNNNDAARDADIVCSTIHSAKGREWDNVIVIYRDKPGMSQQDRRLYYVALTRGCKSEFVLAYGTNATSEIETKYRTRIAELEAIKP